jgi:putative copper export protein/methionine-rich copper-binding protein CopC
MNRLLKFVIGAALFLAPTQARAHAHLTRSAPAQGSRLEVSPNVIQLWFSESPELAMTAAQLNGADGKSYRLGAGTLKGSNGLGIDFPVQESLLPGKYTIAWRTAAADGHPSHGKFTFIVLPAAATGTVARQVTPQDSVATEPAIVADTADGNENPAASGPNSLARAFLFFGLLLLIGAVTFSLYVVPRAGRVTSGSRDVMKRRAAAVGMFAAIVIMIAALLRLYFELEMMKAMPDMPGMTGFSNQQMVVHTTWGLAFMTQIVAAGVAFAALAFARRGVIPAWYIAAVAALSLAITPALSGHAASSPRFTSVMVLSDWLHVLGAASWLGSLACVMAIGVPLALRQEGDERWKWVSSLVNEFSRLALVSVAMVIASGVFASWVHLARLADLWTSNYGKILLVKLVLVSIALLIGAYNFKRVQPRLEVEQGTVRLRSSATLELGTGFLILLVTGFLTGVSP